MTPLAVLAVTTVVIALAFLAWRERARSRAEAMRARHVESISADAANLLAAVSQSLLLARDEGQDPREAREWVEAAYDSTRSTIALFEAARLQALGAPPSDETSAEGALRLAVAIARSDGAGILLESDRCELALSSSAALLDELVRALGAIHAVVRKPGFITVRIESERVTIRAPVERAPALESLGDAIRRAGWTLDTRRTGEELALDLRPTAGRDQPSGEGAPRALAQRGRTA